MNVNQKIKQDEKNNEIIVESVSKIEEVKEHNAIEKKKEKNKILLKFISNFNRQSTNFHFIDFSFIC